MAQWLTIMAVIFAAILPDLMTTGRSEETTRQLTCSGSKMGQTTSTNINGAISSDNNIALKFQTDDFVGEFFHYTNYLFFTYQTPYLARLTCMPQ